MGPGAGRWYRDGCCFEPAWRTLKQSLSGRGLAVLMVSWCGFASPYYFEAHSNIVPIVAGVMVITVSWNRTRHLSWACSHLCSWSFQTRLDSSDTNGIENQLRHFQVIHVIILCFFKTNPMGHVCTEPLPASHVAFGQRGSLGTSHPWESIWQ